MARLTFWSTAVAAIAWLVAVTPHAGNAQTARHDIEAIVKDYLATHPDEVGDIVKNYLIRNPQALREVFAEIVKQRTTAKARADATATTSPDRSAAVRTNTALLFGSTRQVTLGNPDGDVTMVEFFDYNCGYCKRALADTMTLIESDPRLKIVLKELPILGPGSIEAARVAIAVHMQDSAGTKYLAFHRKLLGSPGPVNREKALAAATEQGLDAAQLERDMASDEARATIEENLRLAQAVGINGTPGYVIGDSVLPGAVGAVALRRQVETARSHGK